MSARAVVGSEQDDDRGADGPAGAPRLVLDRPALVESVLDAVRREYPHVLVHELRSDADVVPPRACNPSFYGCYDWHSAVHSHWLLVRCLSDPLPAELAGRVQAVLDEHLSPERLEREHELFAGPGGRTAERPYGWSWCILLHAECAASPHGARWATALEPLATLLRDRLVAFFESVLAFPVRSGTHADSAFSLQVMLQAARLSGSTGLESAASTAARRYYGGDVDLPLGRDPSGGDFLDPQLTEAALMASVLGAADFAGWLARACPGFPGLDWSPPAFRPDGPDPATVHLEGLLASRAWCLHRIAGALEPGSAPARAARSGRDAHLAALSGVDPTDGFNRSHWLPSFLVYLDAWLSGSI